MNRGTILPTAPPFAVRRAAPSRSSIRSMLGSDPKTTVAGILLAIGLALQGGARAAGSPWWVGLLGTVLAAVAAAFLGGSARDGGSKVMSIRQDFTVSDPDRVEGAMAETIRKAAAATKGGPQ
jgi:hypothetical protein